MWFPLLFIVPSVLCCLLCGVTHWRLSKLESKKTIVEPVATTITPWGAIFIGHSPQGEPVVLSTTSVTVTRDTLDIREFLLPKSVLPGATLFVWGPVVLGIARVGETVLDSNRAPFYLFERGFTIDQTLVFGVTPQSASYSLPKCLADRRKLS